MNNRGRLRSACLAGIVGAGVALGAQSAPSQPPTFRSEISYVEVPVRVLDGRGEFVRGLTAADFSVRENGRPQTIVKFAAVEYSSDDRRFGSCRRTAGAGSD